MAVNRRNRNKGNNGDGVDTANGDGVGTANGDGVGTANGDGVGTANEAALVPLLKTTITCNKNKQTWCVHTPFACLVSMQLETHTHTGGRKR